MVNPKFSCWLATLLVGMGILASPLHGATVTTGDVTPLPWTSPTDLYIGNTGDGTLDVNEGSLLTLRSGTLGLSPGSTGTATVTGVGSKWTNSGQLFVGNSGNGTLTIETGGLVSNFVGSLGYWSGSTGTATVTGVGSKWINGTDLSVGNFGSGTLTIEAGGQVSNLVGSLGYGPGSTGTATVTGAGSKWTNRGRLFVGLGGDGILSVTDGGEVVAAELYASLSDLLGNGIITATKGGVLDVNLLFNTTHGTQQNYVFGSGGTLSVNWNGGVLGAGYKHNGNLTVAESVNISSFVGYLGYRPGSTGTATVTGVGSQWSNSSTLFVGNSGNGTLTIETGGLVSNSSGYLGDDSGSTGTATVTGVGSKWANSGSLYVGDQGTGILRIMSGGLVSVFGTLRIDTDLNNDSFINIATGGMLALRANVEDSLSQFMDLVQGTDAIRYWDATVEDWAPLTSATYGTDYTLEYLTSGELGGYTLLTVGRAGDFDNDGDVDGRDFLAWQRNPELGSYADWQNAYGNSSIAANSTSIPEPSSLVLMMVFATCAHRRRWL